MHTIFDCIQLSFRLTKAYDDHDSLSKEMQSKKRKAQDDVSNEAAKRQKGEPSAAPTATTPATAPAPAAAPSQAPPASSGYSQQTTTADNSAYSQAAYNAYYQVSARDFSMNHRHSFITC